MTLLCLGLLSAPCASGQGAYDDVVLGFKRLFAANEIAALNEPYVGVTTSTGVVSGVFPIEATGVSTAPINSAAEKFLATLTRPQQIKTIFAVDDPEWRDRHLADQRDGHDAAPLELALEQLRAAAQPATQRPPADRTADRESGARGEHRADRCADEAEHWTERDHRRADQHENRERHDAAEHECREHERHAPRAGA